MRILRILLLSICLVAILWAIAGAQPPAPAPAPAPASAPPAAPAPPSAPLPPPGSPRMPPMSMRAISPANVLLLPMNLGITGGMDNLSLTDEQKPKVGSAQRNLDMKMVQLSAAVLAATKQLVEGVQAPGTTPAKLKELTAAADKAEADIVHARLEFILDLKPILTPEQNKTIMDLIMRRLEGPMPPSMGPGMPAAPRNIPARPAGSAPPAGAPAGAPPPPPSPAAGAPPAHP